jgi:hypothetical protein
MRNLKQAGADAVKNGGAVPSGRTEKIVIRARHDDTKGSQPFSRMNGTIELIVKK